MGFAIAEAATNRGADVTVVIGQTSVVPPNNVKVIKGISAEDMYRNVIKELPEATIFIGTAAVSDYRPKKVFETKIKKDEKDLLTLHLEKTLDILSKVSENRHNGLLLVGFAAETNNAVGYAKAKMNNKNLDMVIANDITNEGAGFDTDTNIATILTRDSKKEIGLPLMQKSELAKKILDEIAVLRKMNK
jgi:phosphopantothenoylcysteine decarboxylase/phosphopantothenate--cysteine ligase